jgi:hypothetical protein
MSSCPAGDVAAECRREASPDRACWQAQPGCHQEIRVARGGELGRRGLPIPSSTRSPPAVQPRRHLERHQPGQFTKMPRCEHPRGYLHHPSCGNLISQRSSRCQGSLRVTTLYAGAPLLRLRNTLDTRPSRLTERRWYWSGTVGHRSGLDLYGVAFLLWRNVKQAEQGHQRLCQYRAFKVARRGAAPSRREPQAPPLLV